MHTVRRAATIAAAVAVLVSFVPAAGHADPHRPKCDDGHVRCLIRKYWEGDDEQALRVAKCESEYNPRSENSCCVGVFQVYASSHEREMADLGYTRDDLYDAGKNTRVAYSIYHGDGDSWGQWDCKP